MCFFRLSFLYVAASRSCSRLLFSIHPFRALFTLPFFCMRQLDGSVYVSFFAYGIFGALLMRPFRPLCGMSTPFHAPFLPGGISALSRKNKTISYGGRMVKVVIWKEKGNKKNVRLLMVGGERNTLSTTYFVFQVIPWPLRNYFHYFIVVFLQKLYLKHI